MRRPFPSTVFLAALVVSMLIDLSLFSDNWDTPAVTYSLLLVTAVYSAVRSLKHRKGLRAFADSHGLRFVGLSVSDARPPFTHFGLVKSSVLLFNVVAGQWDGLDTTVFEMRRRTGAYSAAIVRLPDASASPWIHPYSPAVGGAAGHNGAHVVVGEGAGEGYLLFLATGVVSPDSLPHWLTQTVAIAKAGIGR